MAYQARLWRIIRVRIGPRKSKYSIPIIRRTNILIRRNRRLRGQTSGLRSRIRIAHIRQLVADTVHDDRRVERLLLSFVDQGIDGLEGELGGGATVQTGFEFHGRDTEAEVQTRDGGGLDAAGCFSRGTGRVG